MGDSLSTAACLNHGSYRLLPFGEPGDRRGESYKISGETVVEPFRLISGKWSQDLRELHSPLVSRGYEEAEVRRFFAPLMSKVSQLSRRCPSQRI